MESSSHRTVRVALVIAGVLLVAGTGLAWAQDSNEPGVLEPVTSALNERYGLGPTDVRVPNTDQTVDGSTQNLIRGPVVVERATTTTSMLGYPITRVASPNDDMRQALRAMATAAAANNRSALEAAATDLRSILLGTTRGRIYDGFSMLNFNRWNDMATTGITAADFPPDAVPGEYKTKVAQDTGETYLSPISGETRRILEININMLYYDGQIDSDTFFVRFPSWANPDDSLRINYSIYSLVQEDFSPTLVMLDWRQGQNTVAFPFKGMDSVWVAFQPRTVTHLTVKYPPIRMLRGVYTWGWRVHPPRIQFLQPLYEITNAFSGQPQLEAQSFSYAYRNKVNLTLEKIGDAAPEKKMWTVVEAALGGTNPKTIERWLTRSNQGPRGSWFEWADLAKEQRQVPDEAWDIVEDLGIARGSFGDYQMISVFMNNEMYGNGPAFNEIRAWQQGEKFPVLLINLDNHTHYFRNVDFGTRLHDDILRCCGGGFTSFEIMNFKPSFGAPKVAEMQWRAGWGFRPHYDIIQQQNVFKRGSDRAKLVPYTGGWGGTYYGYLYSAASRNGDFRFNPPPFVIGDNSFDPTWSPNPLRDVDGGAGLLIGQHTPGYGVGQMCPGDPFPGFCRTDIQLANPTGAKNFPPPPLRGQPVFPEDVGKYPGDVYPDTATELRFPPFLRNPAQGDPTAGDIIPPTGAWETFTWFNPAVVDSAAVTLPLDTDAEFARALLNNPAEDPMDPPSGYWVDATFAHGAPVFPGGTLDARVELPRASGQVFYQFDDLFHDNDIFSPHPVAEARDEQDAVVGLAAVDNGGNLTVQGSLSALSTGAFATWVTIFDGTVGDAGCTGTILGNAAVDPATGAFTFGTTTGGTSTVCVRSTVSAAGEAPVTLPAVSLEIMP